MMGSRQPYEIAVVFPHWYSYLSDVMEAMLAVRGVREVCQFRHFTCERMEEGVEWPLGYEPDGVLYADSGGAGEWLKALELPMVNLAGVGREGEALVGVSPESIIGVAMDHFSALGFDRVGFLLTRGHGAAERYLKSFEEEAGARGQKYWVLDVGDGIHAGDWVGLEAAMPELRGNLEGEGRCGGGCLP